MASHTTSLGSRPREVPPGYDSESVVPYNEFGSRKVQKTNAESPEKTKFMSAPPQRKPRRQPHGDWGNIYIDARSMATSSASFDAVATK